MTFTTAVLYTKGLELLFEYSCRWKLVGCGWWPELIVKGHVGRWTAASTEADESSTEATTNLKVRIQYSRARLGRAPQRSLAT